MNRIVTALCLAASALAVALPATAAESFGKLPADKGSKPNGLMIRIVRYQGSTNGTITVDVKNPQQAAQEFTAKGVYFVPEVDEDQAPQRLGAVGPFQIEGQQGQRLDHLVIEPGATKRLKLDVYCIDSHRASPTSSTNFRIAKDRVPAALTRAISADAEKSVAAVSGGYAAPAAKSKVQSEVWKNRDQKWIELDGEGKQEIGKKR
jgi:hypothetical protein